MNKKKTGILLCVAMLIASIAGGCGTDSQNKSTETSKQAESQAVTTEGGSMETQPVKETETSEALQTEEPEISEQETQDTEQYIDNPAASSGEGDTNGFYDDGGTWVTVYKNSSGEWVDESGMVYQFGDDGVTDANGIFYPY